MTILRDGINHVYAELHTAVGVIWPGVRNPTDAVIAVAQQLDPQTVVLVSQLVKPGQQGLIRRIIQPSWLKTKTENLRITWQRAH